MERKRILFFSSRGGLINSDEPRGNRFVATHTHTHIYIEKLSVEWIDAALFLSDDDSDAQRKET